MSQDPLAPTEREPNFSQEHNFSHKHFEKKSPVLFKITKPHMYIS